MQRRLPLPFFCQCRSLRGIQLLLLLLLFERKASSFRCKYSYSSFRVLGAKSNYFFPNKNSAVRMSSGASVFWDGKYSEDKDSFVYGTEPNDFLKETLPTLKLPSGANCLLLADGEGRNGVFMAHQYGCKVTSVDISKEGLNKAEALAKQKGVSITTVLADLGEYDFGTEKWDCIVGIFCHFPPPVRTRVLQAIPPSLKAGGTFVLECYTPDQPLKYKTGGPPTAELTYSSKILSDELDGKLTIERNEELVRDVVEGTLHTGTAAVVQFTGRK